VGFFADLPYIHANYGVFAVFGEHDLRVTAENAPDLRNLLSSRGITLLNNTTQAVRIGQENVYIVGVFYPSVNQTNLNAISGTVKREDFVILLRHTPDAIGDMLRARDANGRDNWFDIGLFGHTHGDQLPLGLQWLGIAREVEDNHRRGWIEENRIPMLISQGIGTSVLPIRIGCPPQLHVITIRSR
jgi:predicted MPP superfamily phosphohydrolase